MAGDMISVKNMKIKLVQVNKNSLLWFIFGLLKMRIYAVMDTRRSRVPISLGSQFQNRPHASSAQTIPVISPPKQKSQAIWIVIF